MCAAVAFVAMLVAMLPPRLANAESGAERDAKTSADAAVARARSLGLAHGMAWERLVLYRHHVIGGWESDVDGADFFLAPRGKEDPYAELEATVRAFYAPPGADDTHASCNFPARKRFLESALALRDLPAAPCPKLAAYFADMGADGASFVFASNYADNPASAFGHTLLRLRKRGGAGDAADHGIDYTARTATRNPFLYAFEGMAGVFPGLFRFMPYAKMLREYGSHDSRDLWEYDLALAQSEVDLLVLHLWEISGPRIDYLYFTENCSYQIIAALDAAAPRLGLVDDLNRLVLPIDTMKVVANRASLVERVRYRPSARSLYHASLTRLDAQELELTEEVVDHPDYALPRLSRERIALVLDTARLALETRYGGKLDASSHAAAHARLIARRDALGVATVPITVLPSRTQEPAESHASMRFLLGTGLTSQYGNGFATVGYRLALHDFADPPDGNEELLQLQFLDTRLRFDYERHKLTLDRLTFAELTNLHPLGRYEQLVSWRIRAFGMRLHDRAAPDTFSHGIEAGLGATVGTQSERLVAFLLADAQVGFSAGGNLDGIGGSFVRAGVGPAGGIRWHFFDDTVAVVQGGWSYLPGQHLTSTFEARGSLRSGLARNVALGLEGSVQPRSSEIQLASYLYF